MAETATPEAPPSEPQGEELGEAGKKALEAERATARSAEKARKAAEAKAKELEDRLAKFEEGQKSETEKAIEAARKEASEAATKDATAKANARIVRAEVKAAAGNKLADPNDAVRLLDLDQFEVDDDGEVDAAKVSGAIDQLVNDKPYLAVAPKRPTGDGDGGARTPASQNGDESPRGLITAALEANESARQRQ